MAHQLGEATTISLLTSYEENNSRASEAAVTCPRSQSLYKAPGFKPECVGPKTHVLFNSSSPGLNPLYTDNPPTLIPLTDLKAALLLASVFMTPTVRKRGLNSALHCTRPHGNTSSSLPYLKILHNTFTLHITQFSQACMFMKRVC